MRGSLFSFPDHSRKRPAGFPRVPHSHCIQGRQVWLCLPCRRGGDKPSVPYPNHRCPFWLFWKKIDGDSWLTWWLDYLAGKSMYFPKRTPMIRTPMSSAQLLELLFLIPSCHYTLEHWCAQCLHWRCRNFLNTDSACTRQDL